MKAKGLKAITAEVITLHLVVRMLPCSLVISNRTNQLK